MTTVMNDAYGREQALFTLMKLEIKTLDLSKNLNHSNHYSLLFLCCIPCVIKNIYTVEHTMLASV